MELMVSSHTSIGALCRIGSMLCAATLVACGGSDTDTTSDSANAASGQMTAHKIAAPSAAQWSGLIPLTIVPAAAAGLPNGKVLFWASNARTSFGGTGQTYVNLFDPNTRVASELLITQTGHDMFCPGTANLADGSILVNGGDDSAKTTLYNATTGGWSTGAQMNIPRGYEANTVLQDGSVLTLGGSWSGGQGGKNGEVWTSGGGWRSLPGVLVAPAVGPDPGGIYRGDNHMWMFAAPNGKVFQAGPSAAMNWIDTAGSGSITSAGARADDPYSINGNAVMYDVGKILKVGGAPAYENTNATTSAYVIDINAGASVRKIAPMAYPRAFSNAVALPNGQVLVIGGMTYPVPFSDATSVLVPELWDPTTETFTSMPTIAVGRNYHSVALLLPDARVMSGGGGLCGDGCAANHPDVQILTPHYLLNENGTAATRPVINTAPATITQGTNIAVTTDSAIASFALVRVGSATHSVNNDQRRIPLAFSANGTNAYTLAIPSNPGVALPGYYMLFAMNSLGVPSVAKMVRITGTGAPTLVNPGTQTTAVGVQAQFTVVATPASGSITFSAAGLPAGVQINATTGAVSGAPGTTGTYYVTVSARDAGATTSTQFQWDVVSAQTTVRYVRLEADSEINGNPWTSMAEFNVLDNTGAVISRSGWTVSADSAELVGENAPAANAIDGNPSTFWHTQWQAASPPPPHTFTVNLGALRSVGGFKYLPRPGGGNGTIATWRFFTSVDGSVWTLVGQGTFANNASEKTVYPLAGTATDQPPVLGAVANQSSTVGQSVTLALVASDPDGDALTYAASGLPTGVAINTATGLISGVPSAAGTYAVVAVVSDGRGGSASRSFAWTVSAAGGTGVTARYVRLQADSEINGNPWTSMAEFNLLDANGAVMSRTGWSVSADSAELVGENAPAANAIDGNAATFWHTQWQGGSPPPPHTFTVNLGAQLTIGGFKYLPRPGGGNGTIAAWRFFISADGNTWTQIAQGTFANTAAEKTVYPLSTGTIGNQGPTLNAVADQSGVVGQSASLALGASDPDGDPLTYSATGLPAGLSVNTATGLISGTPTTAGTYNASVGVSDGRGGSATRAFVWTVTAAGAGGGVRYVRLVADSEINGHPWTSMAEFNLLDATGAVMSRSGWVASADSVELVGENAPASNAIDGNASTFWHTQWKDAAPPPPHAYTVDLGTARVVRGFKYLPRPGGGNGTIAAWRFFTSVDGATWTQVTQGTFANNAAEKTVQLP